MKNTKTRINLLFRILSLMLVSASVYSASSELLEQVKQSSISIYGDHTLIISDSVKRKRSEKIDKRIEEEINKEIAPLTKEANELSAVLAQVNENTAIENRLKEIKQEINSLRNNKNKRDLKLKYTKYEDERTLNRCSGTSKKLLIFLEGDKEVTRCLTKSQFETMVTYINKKAKDKSSLVNTKKLYRCYSRDKNILSQASSCTPPQIELTDSELEKIGKKNCYPVDLNFKNSKGEFTHISKLINLCLEETCIEKSKQLSFENFELISFNGASKKCTQDMNNSRVCAQTYNCKNKTYQVSCEFSINEKSKSDNPCDVETISEEVIGNKCNILELGAQL